MIRSWWEERLGMAEGGSRGARASGPLGLLSLFWPPRPRALSGEPPSREIDRYQPGTGFSWQAECDKLGAWPPSSRDIHPGNAVKQVVAVVKPYLVEKVLRSEEHTSE